MKLYEIKNRPLRIASYLVVAPASLLLFFVFLTVYSTASAIKCGYVGFIDYYKGNNELLKYNTLKTILKGAWSGKS